MLSLIAVILFLFLIPKPIGWFILGGALLFFFGSSPW
jgi:hypothetical protein